jgi:hypothetical protein
MVRILQTKPSCQQLPAISLKSEEVEQAAPEWPERHLVLPLWILTQTKLYAHGQVNSEVAELSSVGHLGAQTRHRTDTFLDARIS